MSLSFYLPSIHPSVQEHFLRTGHTPGTVLGTGQDFTGKVVDYTALLPTLEEVNHFLYSYGTVNLLTVPVQVKVRLYLSRCSPTTSTTTTKECPSVIQLPVQAIT